MGINTGFCNVGNFGSADRMDYTIIGAEANLAARLQSDLAHAGVARQWFRSPDVLAPKLEAVVKQCELFPAAEHDDLVDTCTQAWALARRAGYLTMDSDPHAEDERDAQEDRRRESAYG